MAPCKVMQCPSLVTSRASICTGLNGLGSLENIVNTYREELENHKEHIYTYSQYWGLITCLDYVVRYEDCNPPFPTFFSTSLIVICFEYTKPAWRVYTDILTARERYTDVPSPGDIGPFQKQCAIFVISPTLILVIELERQKGRGIWFSDVLHSLIFCDTYLSSNSLCYIS